MTQTLQFKHSEPIAIIMIIITIIIMMMIMMMMMMRMIIIIAFKGAIRDCLQSHCVANILQHIHSSGPGTSTAYHVQHVVLRATWYEEKAQLLRLTEFKSHLFEFYFKG